MLGCKLAKWREDGDKTAGLNLCFIFSPSALEDEEEEDGHTVVATARGVFNSNGGVLSSIETGVSIIIPQGAIPEGIEQEIYFKVCRDNSILPPLDKEKGKSWYSLLCCYLILLFSNNSKMSYKSIFMCFQCILCISVWRYRVYISETRIKRKNIQLGIGIFNQNKGSKS